MAGTYDTQEIQMGQETTWNTPVAGTARMMGIIDCVFKPVKPSVVNKMLHGSLGVGNIGTRRMGSGSGTIKGKVTYEDFPIYWMENMFGKVTPSGAGPYVRAGAPPLLVSALNPRYETLIKGDADGVYQLQGALLDDLSISVKQSSGDNEMLYDGKLIGGDVTTATLASLADRAVTAITANDVALFVDAIGGTPGATAVPSTAWGWDVKFSSGRKLKPYLGQSTPGGIAQPSFDATKNTLTLSLELNATSKAYLDAIIGASTWQRIVRMRATQGANIFQIDMGVQAIDSPAVVTANDGVKSLVIPCMALESTGLGSWMKFSSTNSIAAVV